MNVLIQLSHPAHFHLYKNVGKNLMADGHQVLLSLSRRISWRRCCRMQDCLM